MKRFLFSVLAIIIVRRILQTGKNARILQTRKNAAEKVVPIDVIAEILLCLPVKTLQRFKSVSKPWNNLISEPWFVDLHRQRSRRKLNVLYIASKEKRNFFGQYRTNLTFTCTDFEGNILDVSTKTLESCTGLSHYFRSVSSYNVLICFMTWRKSSCVHIYLYNPVSHQVFALPDWEDFLEHPLFPQDSTIGFGYVSSTREYKVLSLLFNTSKTKCEILTFSPRGDGSINNPCSSWRDITQNLLHQLPHSEGPAFVRECFYWLTFNHSLRGKSNHIIISFDLRTEKFSTILPPSELNNESKSSFMKLIVDDFQGKLILVKYQDLSLYVSLWVLEDYDRHIWNKTYDIDFIKECYTKMYPCDSFRIYGYMPNGELLIVGRVENFYSYYFYNAKSHSVSRVAAPNQNTLNRSWGHNFYWESMVTL